MTQQTCERCGHRFTPAAAPGGMCPRCLLLGGTDEPLGEDFSVEELRDAVPGFRVEALLGRGGMGAVFRARQLDLDRDVAIKFIAARAHDPSFGERFEREARTMARLNHPNIVTAHSYGRTEVAEGNRENGGRARHGGHAFIVMEYVAGGDLAQLIAAGNIPEAVALSLVEQVCRALAYAHEQGCVHRDIKPGNILVDLHGRVKVADFGLAKLFRENAPASALTLSFVGVGTAHYAAPEQTKPGAPVDHRADIYALGVLLYEMLTGEVPRGAFQNPSAKSGALRRWDGLIVRAMAAQPERRYGSTQELGRELAGIRRELAFRAGVRRFGWKVPALVVAGIAVAAVALVPVLQPADFTISQSGRALVLTDRSGRGGELAVSEPEPGHIRFSAAQRTFRTAYGWRSAGSSAALPLVGVRRIAVAGKTGGVRTLHVGSFTQPLPSLALRGGAATFEGGLAFAPDASLEFDGESAEVAAGAQLVTSGTGSITFTARGRIALGKGAGLETQDGGLALSANATGTTVGAFIGIDLPGATLTTRGTGTIALTGRGGAGSAASDLYGVLLHRGAVVRSTLDAAGAGAIAVTGFGGGPGGSRNRGVGLSGDRTQIASVSGAVTIAGTAGGGEGDNLSGIDLRDGGRVVSTGRGRTAASIDMRGTGGHGTGDYSCGILVGTTDANNAFGAGIASVDGTVSLRGTGGGGTATCVGVFIGDGATVAASASGAVSLVGVGTDQCPRHGFGVLIFAKHQNGSPSQVTVTDGDLTIDGIARHPASSAVKIEDPAFVRSSGQGRITLLGDSMEIHGTVDAGTNDVILLPHTAGTDFNLGSILGPAAGTLELSNQELSRITAGTLRIGDLRSGGALTTTPLWPTASLVLTTGGAVKINTPIVMKPGHDVAVTALNVYVAFPGAGLTASGTGTISVTTTREFSMLRDTSISTEDGNLTISAHADGSAVGDFHGVEVLGGSIRTTGSGTLSVAGTRGSGGDADHFGVNIQTGGSIAGGTGGTTVTANGNGARYALAVGTSGAGAISSGSPLTLRADSILLGSAATVSSGTAALSITPRAVGTLIALGGVDVLAGSPLTLGLSDAELDRITAGAVQWGDERTGAITITEPISPANRAKLATLAIPRQ